MKGGNVRTKFHKFVSWPQIVMWHKDVKPIGTVSILKMVEHKLALIIEIKPSGRHKVKTAMDLA